MGLLVFDYRPVMRQEFNSNNPPVPKVYPKINSFTVSPSTVNYNDPITFAWTTSDAKDCIIAPIIGSVPTSGTITIRVTESTTFVLTAENNDGAVTASVNVTVNGIVHWVLDGYTKGWSITQNTPFISGTLRNDGTARSLRVTISWQAYDTSDAIIDIASASVGDERGTPPGGTVSFNAYFTKFRDWSQIGKLTYSISW